jgi:hypothetical protein
MTTDERVLERRMERIAAGREAWTKLNQHQHFGQWLAIADCLYAIREEAMEQANTNHPQGPPYRRALNSIIEKREPWVAKINDSVRAHCYWLVERLPAVQQWREGLTFEQRDMWNHPTTIKRNYERMMVAKKPKESGAPPARISLQDQIIRLQEENDMLRGRQGSGFMPGASAQEFGEAVAGHHKPRYLRELAKVLVVLAEREESQDRLEAKARTRTKRKTAPASADDSGGDAWPNLALPAMIELTKGRPPRG